MNINKQKAFSLLEVLLALTLGIILISVFLKVYLGWQSVYKTIQENARLQENLRFVSYFLREQISMAGYSGCGRINNLDLNSYQSYDFSLQNSVKGYSSNNLPSSFHNYNIAQDSDVIVIQKADENITAMTGDIIKKDLEVDIYVIEHPASKINDPLLISDCVKADLFPADNYQGNMIKTTWSKMRTSYQKENSQVAKYTEIVYFISSSTANSSNGKTRFGLYYAINGGNKVMLAEGIAGMKIKYGVDENDQGKISKYFTTQEMENSVQNLWEKVLSVIITFNQTSQAAKFQNMDIYIKLRQRGL